MEEQFRVSSFRTKIYLGGCREIVASINHSSPNLVQQTIFRYFLRRATLRPVSSESVCYCIGWISGKIYRRDASNCKYTRVRFRCLVPEHRWIGRTLIQVYIYIYVYTYSRHELDAITRTRACKWTSFDSIPEVINIKYRSRCPRRLQFIRT